MAKEIKTIGVLTSGGDAPGMNAAIRAVVRTALNKGLKVKGIQKGYNGLLNDEIIDMEPERAHEIRGVVDHRCHDAPEKIRNDIPVAMILTEAETV